MEARLISIICSATFFVSKASLANTYDDCILQYMNSATDKTAVYAIERSCISKTSVQIPYNPNFDGALSANWGNFNIGGGAPTGYGLVITLRNTTEFDITELNVVIRDKATLKDSVYPVREFHATLPVGSIITGLGEPVLVQTIKRGESREFFVHIYELAKTPTEFGKRFDWFVIPTKGIPVS